MTATTDSNTTAIPTQRSLWLAIAAILVAAAPHFFLRTPLDFYAQNNTQAWLGLTIWSSAFLGAVALFIGVDLNTRIQTPIFKNSEAQIAAGIGVPLLVLIALGAWNFDGYQHVGDLSKLGLAMALYAGVFAVGCLFWQGLFQRHVLDNIWKNRVLAPLLRAASTAIVATALWLPFLRRYSWENISETLDQRLIVYLAIALLFECGLSVLACAGAAVFIGVAWAWTHQMIFF